MGAPQQGGATWGAAVVPIVRSRREKERERDAEKSLFSFAADNITTTEEVGNNKGKLTLLLCCSQIWHGYMFSVWKNS